MIEIYISAMRGWPIKRGSRQVLWLAAVAVSGCGGQPLEMAPVGGTVTLDGQPVGDILVVFRPQATPGSTDAPTRPAMGSTDDQGRYQLNTSADRKGAAVGTHAVSVAASSGEIPPPGQLPAGYTVEVKPGENTIDLELEPNPQPEAGPEVEPDPEAEPDPEVEPR